LVRLAAVVTVGALALAGCGGDGDKGGSGSGGSGGSGGGAAASGTVHDYSDASAEEVLAQAKKAAQSASSVHMTGAFEENGSSLKIDMTLSHDKGGEGTITIDGDQMTIRQVGDEFYVKGDEKVWTSMLPGAANAASKLDGKWVHVAKDDDAAARFADITSIDQAFEGLLKPTGKTLSKVKGKDVHGTPTIGLLDKGDSPEQAATLFIATRGPAYPLLVEPQKGSGKVEFGDWNKAVTVEKPAGKPVELSSLVKG
jgi:putative sterol carrier protein